MKIRLSLAEDENPHYKALKETGFWGKQAAGCIFGCPRTGRLLLPLRSLKVTEPNTWGTWGGALDEDETPEQGVKREIQEETEYSGRYRLVPLSVFVHPSGFKYHNFLAIVLREFKPKLNWETHRAVWFEREDIPHRLHSGLQALLHIESNQRIIEQNIGKTRGKDTGFSGKGRR